MGGLPQPLLIGQKEGAYMRIYTALCIIIVSVKSGSEPESEVSAMSKGDGYECCEARAYDQSPNTCHSLVLSSDHISGLSFSGITVFSENARSRRRLPLSLVHGTNTLWGLQRSEPRSIYMTTLVDESYYAL